MTQTVVPTTHMLDVFKTAWDKADKAGLAGQRTLIALSAVLTDAYAADVPLKGVMPKKLVALIDTDEDIWRIVPGEVDDDTEEPMWSTPGLQTHRTQADLTERYGPVKEVWE